MSESVFRFQSWAESQVSNKRQQTTATTTTTTTTTTTRPAKTADRCNQVFWLLRLILDSHFYLLFYFQGFFPLSEFEKIGLSNKFSFIAWTHSQTEDLSYGALNCKLVNSVLHLQMSWNKHVSERNVINIRKIVSLHWIQVASNQQQPIGLLF